MKLLTISIISLCVIFLSDFAMAQSTLINRFGDDAIASIQGTEKLAILEFQNENGYAVQDLSGIKDISEHPNALEVAPVSEETPALTEAIIDEGFEMFAYEFRTSGNTNAYYRVGDSGKILVIYSTMSVIRLFEKQRNSK